MNAGTQVPLFDLQSQYLALRDRIDARIAAVMPANRFILGPEVAELEAQLADFTGAAHAITVANGTDALIVSLQAAGVGPGDAVFVPSFTFVATAGAVMNVGATPVFVDVEERSFNIDPEHLRLRIDELRQHDELRAKAVIPVDLFGLPADYARLNAVAEHAGLSVIADAAQSVGGAIDGRRVGSLANLSATSFYPTKPLGCYGDGGCVFTDDDGLAEQVRLIRGHGLDPATGHAIRVGMNSRLDTLQAAILLVKLQVFEQELAARNQAAAWYAEGLQGIASTPALPDGYSSTRAVYSIRIANRDRVRRRLQEQGIGTNVYYTAGLHLQPAYRRFGDGPGSLPVTEKLSGDILSLPMSGYLDKATVERICAEVAAAAE